MTATAEDTDRFAKAKAIWDEYQRTHDVTALKGHVAAVDMETGEVRIRPTAFGLFREPVADGRVPSLALFRVGSDTFSLFRRHYRRRVP